MFENHHTTPGVGLGSFPQRKMGFFAEGSVSSAFLFVVAAVAVTVIVPAKAMQRDGGGGDSYPAENFRVFGKIRSVKSILDTVVEKNFVQN